MYSVALAKQPPSARLASSAVRSAARVGFASAVSTHHQRALARKVPLRRGVRSSMAERDGLVAQVIEKYLHLRCRYFFAFSKADAKKVHLELL